MSLLNAKFSLLEIADVEAFTARIIQRSNLRLNPSDHEELQLPYRHHLGALAKAATRTGPFSRWVGYTLALRITDWQRSIKGERNGRSKTEPTNGSHPRLSASMTNTIEWEKLSPRGLAILRLIAIPISNGWSEREVARGLLTTRSWVSDGMDEFRDELERL